jgi:hypothetical protein
MVSYEVSIGFVLISVVLWAGSFNLSAIVEAQRSHLWITNGFGFNPLFFPMAVVFFISSLAETARAPFDLTEAESELVAGYQTEYSSMAFALFWLGEYANVILMCALNAILFWGGYLPPIDWAPLYVVPGILWLFLKILVFFFMFSWVKATVPRYRYDQLMRLGWKIFLPLSLIWVVLISGYLMLTRYSRAEAAVPSPTFAYSTFIHSSSDCVLRDGDTQLRLTVVDHYDQAARKLSGSMVGPANGFGSPYPVNVQRSTGFMTSMLVWTAGGQRFGFTTRGSDTDARGVSAELTNERVKEAEKTVFRGYCTHLGDSDEFGVVKGRTQ